MAIGQMASVVRQLRRAVLGQDGGGLTDAELLEGFLARREEGAFAALVRRHGPMVFNVCRRVLHNEHDAEDAFQATFLVLVRKAASIVPREMVGNWLHGVAYRTALKARALSARRRAREGQVGNQSRPEMHEDVWQDLKPLLDRELSRLPEKHRALVVLCDLEGKTRKEAARQLGLSEGTVSSRLARARRMLARRLAHHRLALSAGGLAALLTGNAMSAGVPAPLVMSTIQAATGVAAGEAATIGLISAKVAALTEGVIKAMLLTRLKLATALLLAVSVICGGMGVLLLPVLADRPAKVKPREGAADKGDTRGGKKAVPKPDEFTIHGSVKAVDAGKHTITIHPVSKKKVEKTFALARDVQVFLEEGKKGQEGKLTDLSEGTGVTLKLSDDKKTVASISARGPTLHGGIKAVDAARNTITVHLKPGDKTFAVSKDVKIHRADGKKGEEGKLSDLTEGSSVALGLSVDRKTVRAITVFPPSLYGVVKAVDGAQGTITVTTKGKEGAEEKTLRLGKELKIALADQPKGEGRLTHLTRGTGVNLTLSPDKGTVVGIFVHSPTVHGRVKSVDAGKHTLTVSTKGKGGVKDRALALPKNVRVILADTAESREGKLSDLAEDTVVVVTLSLDGKTVREITVHGPSFTGTLKGVDTGSNTITVTVKEDGGLVDKTFGVARGAHLSLSDGKADQKVQLTDLTVGSTVAVKLSVDRMKVVALHVQKRE